MTYRIACSLILIMVLCVSWLAGTGLAACQKGCKMTFWIGLKLGTTRQCYNFLDFTAWSPLDNAPLRDAPATDHGCYPPLMVDYKRNCTGCPGHCADDEVPQTVSVGICGPELAFTVYCDCEGSRSS